MGHIAREFRLYWFYWGCFHWFGFHWGKLFSCLVHSWFLVIRSSSGGFSFVFISVFASVIPLLIVFSFFLTSFSPYTLFVRFSFFLRVFFTGSSFIRFPHSFFYHPLVLFMFNPHSSLILTSSSLDPFSGLPLSRLFSSRYHPILIYSCVILIHHLLNHPVSFSPHPSLPHPWFSPHILLLFSSSSYLIHPRFSLHWPILLLSSSLRSILPH